MGQDMLKLEIAWNPTTHMHTCLFNRYEYDVVLEIKICVRGCIFQLLRQF